MWNSGSAETSQLTVFRIVPATPGLLTDRLIAF